MSIGECIKTGADVFMKDYGAIVHGDLYRMQTLGDDVYAFVYCHADTWTYPTQEEALNAKVNLRVDGDVMDVSYNVWVFPGTSCSDFFYTGARLI